MSPGELKQIKEKGTGIAQFKTEPQRRNIIPTPDFREYYIKHAASMGTKDHFRLVCSNTQMAENMFNNVSLWMSWPFAKALGIYILMEVRKFEENYSEIKLDDIVALKNYMSLIKLLSSQKISSIDETIKKIEGDLVDVAFTCDNVKCKKINVVRIPRANLPKDNVIMGMVCPHCGNELKVRYKEPKKEKKTIE